MRIRTREHAPSSWSKKIYMYEKWLSWRYRSRIFHFHFMVETFSLSHRQLSSVAQKNAKKFSSWNEMNELSEMLCQWGGDENEKNMRTRNLGAYCFTPDIFMAQSYFNSSQAQKSLKSHLAFGPTSLCATAVRAEWNCRWTMFELLLRWLLKAAKFSVHHHMDGRSWVQRVWVTAPKIPNFVENEWSFQFTTRWGMDNKCHFMSSDIAIVFFFLLSGCRLLPVASQLSSPSDKQQQQCADWRKNSSLSEQQRTDKLLFRSLNSPSACHGRLDVRCETKPLNTRRIWVWASL